MMGFQLRVDLPARDKMTPPRYRDVSSEMIPELELARGVVARLIAGRIGQVDGPVQDIVAGPQYMDCRIAPGSEPRPPVPPGLRAFVYVVDGTARFPGAGPVASAGSVVRFSAGDEVRVQAGDQPLRLLLISGRPLNEPIAWRGPIAMNTREELDTAFAEYQAGTFIRHGNSPGRPE
jgi:hypothetical protein